MDGRVQTGIVACASIDDYLNNIIKKHEKTRADKELDRINHVDRTSAQTGPIFLAYRANEKVKDIICTVKEHPPIYDFVCDDDEIRHRVLKYPNRKILTVSGRRLIQLIRFILLMDTIGQHQQLR